MVKEKKPSNWVDFPIREQVDVEIRSYFGLGILLLISLLILAALTVIGQVILAVIFFTVAICLPLLLLVDIIVLFKR